MTQEIKYYKVGQREITVTKDFNRLKDKLLSLEDRDIIKGWGIIDDERCQRDRLDGDIWTLESITHKLIRDSC